MVRHTNPFLETNIAHVDPMHHCSFFVILKPLPYEITRGFTLGFPSAKIVTWTEHYLLVRPEPWVAHHTLELPFLAYLFPLSITKGNGVWSMFRMSFIWYVPNLWICKIFEWNFTTEYLKLCGSLFAQWIFLQNEILKWLVNLKNHLSEALKFSF